MIRNPSSTRPMPYIVLAIALLALVMLVANLAKVPVGVISNSDSNKIPLAPALSQAKQGSEVRGEPISENAESARVIVLSRAQQADAARWQGMAIAYQMEQTGLSRPQLADAARWTAMSRQFAAKEAAALERARGADTARWQGMAIAYQMEQTGLSRAQLADAARWTAMARQFAAKEAAALARARAAEIARWQGMAIAYYMQQTGLSRAQLADAARWSAIAIRYGADPEDFSPYLRLLLDK